MEERVGEGKEGKESREGEEEVGREGGGRNGEGTEGEFGRTILPHVTSSQLPIRVVVYCLFLCATVHVCVMVETLDMPLCLREFGWD